MSDGQGPLGPREELKIVLAGIGGQGVVFATRLLARTGIGLGLPVMASETHGMSQRGGSVVAHLKLGGTLAPLIRRGTADVLLALDPDEALRNLTYLRRNGAVFANSGQGLRPEVEDPLAEHNIQVHVVSASQIATTLGAAAVANVILIGFAAAHASFRLPLEAIRSILIEVAPHARDLNLRALEAGYREGLASSALVETVEDIVKTDV
ncbi:MAG TPA: 2-oxoacid:acceptor oxidoreductase family protein [Anaerolineales bacterium]|nr:2-oxoacid:acceptor oxidoreductase family protein [Anaerolineales bacterium]